MFKLPEDVKFIMNTLKDNGYEAYIVGGCVRDALLGREPEDWDMTTNATPDAVDMIFDKTIDVGKRFGTIRILLKDHFFEVTTFRKDSKYSDSRRPDEVFFSQDLKEDLKRRDFTINAMAYNPESGLIDEFNGQKHLYKKIIMCVGNANERFQEDALRIMRGIRFATQYEFEIEKNTYEAMVINKEKLRRISSERIQQEFNKMLLSLRPSYGVNLMMKMGIDIILFPEYHGIKYMESKSDLRRMDCLEPHLILRLTEFFNLLTQGVNEPIAETVEAVLKRLKYDKKTITQVSSLFKARRDIVGIHTPVDLKGLMRQIGEENTTLLLKLYTTNCLDKGHAIFLQRLYEDILKRHDPIGYKDLCIKGEDLIKAGFSGREIGEAIDFLIQTIHDEPKKNKREVLLEIMKTLRNR